MSKELPYNKAIGPHHEKTCLLHMRKQRRRSAVPDLRDNCEAEADQGIRIVFAIKIEELLFYLNLKFQSSSHLM